MNEVRGLGPVAAAGIVVTLVPTLAVDLGPRIWWPSRPAREGFRTRPWMPPRQLI
jgi:hypothetical protein